MKNRKKFIRLVLVLTTLTLSTVIITSNIFNTNSVKGVTNLPDKAYITIVVHNRDTLWGIASEYMNNDYYSFDTYIDEVVGINNIQGSKIYAGQQIIIPIIE